MIIDYQNYKSQKGQEQKVDEATTVKNLPEIQVKDITTYKTWKEKTLKVETNNILEHPLVLLYESAEEETNEFLKDISADYIHELCEQNGFALVYNKDGSINEDSIMVLDEGVLTDFLKRKITAAKNLPKSFVGSSKGAAKGIAASAAIGGVGALAMSAGAPITVGAGLAAAAVAAVIGAAFGTFATSLYRKKQGYVLRFGGLVGVRTRDAIYEMYLTSIKNLAAKRNIPFDIKHNGNEIRLKAKFSLPNHQPPEFLLTVKETVISFFPLNTGGTTALDKYTFKRDSIDLGGKKIQGKRTHLDKMLDELEGFKNRGYLGNEYKVPRRKLTYQEDMLVMWYIIVDMISEILADFAVKYQEMVTGLQAAKGLDSFVFTDFDDKYDITSYFLRDKEKSEFAKIKDEIKTKEKMEQLKIKKLEQEIMKQKMLDDRAKAQAAEHMNQYKAQMASKGKYSTPNTNNSSKSSPKQEVPKFSIDPKFKHTQNTFDPFKQSYQEYKDKQQSKGRGRPKKS